MRDGGRDGCTLGRGYFNCIIDTATFAFISTGILSGTSSTVTTSLLASSPVKPVKPVKPVMLSFSSSDVPIESESAVESESGSISAAGVAADAAVPVSGTGLLVNTDIL